MKVYTTKTLGRYNMLSSDKQWYVALYVDGAVAASATWPEDNEPNIDNRDEPSEVLAAIEARLDSYWISTGREEDRAKIAALRKNIEAIDAAWALGRLTALQKQSADMFRQMDRLRNICLEAA